MSQITDEHAEPLVQELAALLPQKPRVSRETIRDLLAQGPREFLDTALRLDPLFDLKLAGRISAAADSIDPVVARQLLAVLDPIADRNRLLPMLVKLLRHPSQHLRSKAALLVGRSSKSSQWTEQLLREPDGRVRANSVEALWGVDTPAARAILWEAARDSHQRVVGNALLGLYRLGETGSIAAILRMAERPEAPFRSSAAWVMGETGDPRFLPVLTQMVRESDPGARHSVFRALRQLKKSAGIVAEAPRLRVELCAARTLADGSRQVRAAVGRDEGEEVDGIRGTHLVLWEDSRMICDYTVQVGRAPTAITLGLVMAGRGEPPVPGAAMVEAVDACLSSARKVDRWAALAYAQPPDSDDSETGAKTPPRPTGIDLLKKALKLEPAALERAWAAPAVTRSDALAGIQALLVAFMGTTGARHILVLDDQDNPSLGAVDSGDWQIVARKALSAGVPVHALVVAGPEEPATARMGELCEQTGGVFVRVPAAAALIEVARKLYFALLHPCDIVYRPAVPELPPAELKLQVYDGQSYGESVLVL